MATLEKIRSKGGLIVALIIGLALFAFILQDMLTPGKSALFGGSSNEVGEISGKKVSYEDYASKVEQLKQNYTLMYGREANDERLTEEFQERAWQEIISERVLFTEFDKLGLKVSSDELKEMFFGKTPHYRVRQVFTNPQTGEFMSDYLNKFMAASEQDPQGDQMKVRVSLEKEVIDARSREKYSSLIVKGITAPLFMAKNDFVENNKKVDFNYVVQAYTAIADKDVKIEASDLKKYYNEHKYLYEQTPSRDLEYVSFEVQPSPADVQATIEELNKIKPEFQTVSDVEVFVNQNSDVPYIPRNYKASDLPDSVSSFMFNASVGDVYGPYFDNGSYKLAKLYKVVYLPDSVKARHILIVPKGQTQQDVTNAKNLADSISNAVSKGADFSALAQKYSDDRNSALQGGDLGWLKEGTSFSDSVFRVRKGETKVLATQYGYHVLQVTDKGSDIKKVNVAIIENKLEPSPSTSNAVFAAASRFASQNRNSQQFNNAVAKQNLAKRIAPGVTENDRALPGLEQARDLIKWAYSAKEGEVSQPINIGNERYVVAALTKIRKKGTATLEEVKNDVEVAVRKIKKAEMISQNLNKLIAGNPSIQSLALKLNSPMETATGINFSAFQLPGAGIEPKVIAAATNLPKDKLSQPIDGNNGVYVLFVTNTDIPQTKDYSESIQRLNNASASRAVYDAFNALVKSADITDRHMRFF